MINLASVKAAPKNQPDGTCRRMVETVPIIAICHLSWDWVWQRPQQFLSRLGRTHPLLFVETHCSRTDSSYINLRVWKENPKVRIVQMHLPEKRWQDGAFIDRERRRMLIELLGSAAGRDFRHAILWINDPMAVTAFAGELEERMIVYDCMDELSQFAGAPAGLADRERQLVGVADLIFCGGQKMRRKRLPVNKNTHFYGTGVDCKHFGLAMDSARDIHPDIAALPGPVLGYFGVIDERIDYELLARLADADPDWSIAMVGPFAKVDPASVPRRPNLHWLGARPYADLPALTRGMSVCLMPFAINAATEYINPTKALEYMAAGKPVVSTALDEVRSNFGVAARIADTHERFIEFCREEAVAPNRWRIRRGLVLAAENTWESIVSKMNGHMQDVLDAKESSDALEGTVVPQFAKSPNAYV